MEEKSKGILGQSFRNRLYLSDEDKKVIIKDYLSGNETKQSVYFRYTGYPTEHGKISKWMRQFSTDDKLVKSANFVRMSKSKKQVNVESNDFETLKLKKRIEELERQLQTAEMKAIAFSTMVDVAEKEFKIPIRKKLNTKL